MQEDLGGELLSLGDLFPTRECAAKFLDFLSISDSDKDIITANMGTVQSVIGDILKGSSEQFWVDAIKDSQSSKSLYKYSGNPSYTYHLTSEHQDGDCLTFGSDSDGNLEAKVQFNITDRYSVP